MLVIRLTRKGKKNQPFFRVVVVDKRRSSKGGRAAEELGYVDPLTKRKSLKKDRILHWIKMGAKPSATVHNLLVSEKIIDAQKINKSKTKPRSEVLASTTGEPKKTAEVKPAAGAAAPAAPVTEAPTPSASSEQVTVTPENEITQTATPDLPAHSGPPAKPAEETKA